MPAKEKEKHRSFVSVLTRTGVSRLFLAILATIKHTSPLLKPHLSAAD
jgi:hypothetical protein